MHWSLDQIQAAQVDEPCQKECIYRLKKTQERGPPQIKYQQIRVKSINFLEQPATAIYFYDMTQHLVSLELQSEVLAVKNRNLNIKKD